MSGGRTAHSKFHIPINIDETSTCSICSQSDLGALLKKCKLIIWDEAPMTNKLCFEALDRTLRDVLRRTSYDTCETPFENITMVFGGDFRQVLLVIPKGSRQDIVNASLKQSYLWDHCKVLKLTANIRLTVGASPEDVSEIRDFAEWILNVEDGELGEANDGEVPIDVPEELLIDAVDDHVTSNIDFTYPNLLNNINNPSHFQEKAILAPTNEVVDTINDHLLNKFLGEEIVYLSCDSINKTERGSAIDEAVFSPEFIYGLKFSGVPNHGLALKVGVLIMLLRNIDQANGLCNGTRLQVLRLTGTSIQAKIINGTHFEKEVIILRLRITPSDKRLPIDEISAVNGVHRAHMPNGTIWVKGMVSPDTFDAALYTLYENPPIISGSVSLDAGFNRCLGLPGAAFVSFSITALNGHRCNSIVQKLSSRVVFRYMYIVCRAKGQMQIYVNLVDNDEEKILLEVNSVDTIDNVKAKIQELKDIPADKQMLFLPQTRLLDGFTLADYYIQKGSTIQLAQIFN
nr:hypothetical protein [Tanacetum cinerariifolium]